MIIQGTTLKGVAVYDASIPTKNNNMLLYLDAGNSSSYPGSGTTWYDISGNNNNTISNTNATYNSANGGYFNFVPNGWFQTASAKYNVPYTGKTIFMAAKLANAMSLGTYRCMFGSNGSNRNFNLYFYYTGTYQLHYSAAGQGGVSSSMSYGPGNWGTFAVTHTTGGVLTYYYNGQQLGSVQTGVTFSQYLSTSSENVGASDNYWDGPISVVGIWGSAFTPSQIQQCHNSVKARYGLN